MNCRNNFPTIVVVFNQRTFAARFYPFPPVGYGREAERDKRGSSNSDTRGWVQAYQGGGARVHHQGAGLSPKYVLLLTSNDNSFVPANSFYHTGSFLLCMQ